jgi:hypothetical protein
MRPGAVSSLMTNSNEIEAANRAEATALLIRCGYCIYRPEADVDGEDLVVRTPAPEGALLQVQLQVQLKGRLHVEEKRYGGDRQIWMLFPDRPYDEDRRNWYLVPHRDLFGLMKKRHGHSPKWADTWNMAVVPKADREALQGYLIRAR